MPKIKNKLSGLTMNITDEAANTSGSYDSNYWEPIDSSSPTTPVENKPTVNYNPDGSRSLSSVDQYWKDNPILTNKEFVDKQNQTKEDFATRQQQAIDAINNMYVSFLAKADETAKGKVGSANVINALSGQRGSASGAANVDKVNKVNDEIYQGILAEKQNKINSIMNQFYKDQTEELRYQNDLRRQDLDKYLSYMGQKETENLTKSKEMRAELIKSNVKLEDISPDILQRMADAAGYTVDQFKVLYESERSSQEKLFLQNEEKRLLELEKLKHEANPVEKNMLSKGYLPITDKSQLEKLKETDIQRVGDKIYLIPQSIKNDTPEARLKEYEEKKKIDTKYRISGNTSSTSKAFYSSVKEGIANLQKGESWGTVFNRIKSQYPNILNEQIDVALGPDWKQPGAFENWKAKQYKPESDTQWESQSPVWQWLASDEAANMSDEQKKQEIMANGFNPEDFGIY